jgi:hypothetical protein
MRTLILQGILRFFLISLAVSCTKDDNSSTPTSGGRITGQVQVWNDKTTSLADRSGVTVSIDNLSGKSTTTDAEGKFAFDNIPFDSYNLSFSKSGYGTKKIFGVQHSTATSPTAIPLVQFGAVCTTTVTAFSYNNNTYNGVPGASYIYSFNPAPSSSNRAYTRVFLSTEATVSNTNYIDFTDLKSASNNNVTGGLTADELYGMGFNPGQTVYARLYADSFKSNEYVDPATGKTIFPNLNTTTTTAISFIVP